MPANSDNQLITNYLNGDEQSLKILIKRYLGLIYSFAYKYAGNSQDAEDITQETFVKVWRNLKKFNRDKNFKTWIFHIAKNTALDSFKKKKVIPFSNFENEKGENIFIENLIDSNPSPNEIIERADMKRVLSLSIGKLSSKYNVVLSLRHNEHFNFREISEKLEEPLNTVKSRYRRSLILLKKLLAENN